jgi:hypothetical protein
MMGSIIAGILIIIVLLALIGLGRNTVVSGVKKGADKVGITLYYKVQYRLLKMELGI